MKAIVWTKYGAPDVLALREVEKPAPKANELLIRIAATTVTAGDCELRGLQFPFYLNLVMRLWRGLLKPKPNTILGTELAGEIETVGPAVKRFKVGDQVFGAAGVNFGANAEYICLPENPDDMEGGVAIKPANLSYAEAAAVPFGGRDALHFLRKGNVHRGQTILINGAGGSIGTFGIQLAKHFGAEVTAVDSGAKLEMLRAIGADHVIDYTQEDFTKNGQHYDVIFEVVGKSSVARGMRLLNPNGAYLMANPRPLQMLQGVLASMRNSKKVLFQTASGTVADLIFLRELAEAGTIKPVIDRSYPLAQTAEAHRYVETGAKMGNVVIAVSEP